MIRQNLSHLRGFSLIEVLIGGAIAMIGLFASLNLAMSATRGNSERRDVQAAGHLAEHVLATIQAAAVLWIDADPPAHIDYLNKLPKGGKVGDTTNWQNGLSGPNASDKRVGRLGADQKFDGGVLQEVPNDRGQRFCVHYRLTWVAAEVVRADVRVSWARSAAVADKYKTCPVAMINDIGDVGSVSLPALVMRNVYLQ